MSLYKIDFTNCNDICPGSSQNVITTSQFDFSNCNDVCSGNDGIIGIVTDFFDVTFNISNAQIQLIRNCANLIGKNLQFNTSILHSRNVFLNFYDPNYVPIEDSGSVIIDLTNQIFPSIRSSTILDTFNLQFNTKNMHQDVTFDVSTGYDEIFDLRIPYSVSISSNFSMNLSLEGILDKEDPIKKLFDLLPNFFKDFEE